MSLQAKALGAWLTASGSFTRGLFGDRIGTDCKTDLCDEHPGLFPSLKRSSKLRSRYPSQRRTTVCRSHAPGGAQTLLERLDEFGHLTPCLTRLGVVLLLVVINPQRQRAVAGVHFHR